MILFALALGSLLPVEPHGSESPLPLVSIDVEPMADATIRHSIEIVALSERTARDREEWARDYRWIATRTSERGEDRVTAEECPQLRRQVIAFQQLPPIQPATPATVVLDEPLPVDLIVLHGYSTTLRYRTFGGAAVRVSGSESYGDWGSQTVSALLACWPALLP